MARHMRIAVALAFLFNTLLVGCAGQTPAPKAPTATPETAPEQPAPGAAKTATPTANQVEPATKKVELKLENDPRKEHYPAPQELTFPTKDKFRKTRPKPGRAGRFRSPKIKRFQLKNGIKVYFVEDHRLPTFTATLAFDAGALTDPNELVGRAGVCAKLMQEGTADLTKSAFSAKQADIATRIGVWSTSDRTFIKIDTLSEHVPTAANLWLDVLLKPGLRAVDFDRTRSHAVLSLRRRQGSASAFSRRLRRMVLWGDKNPYSRVATEKSLRALTAESCRDFVKTHLTHRGATLFVVGDITTKALRKHLGRLGAWRHGEIKRKTRPLPMEPRKDRVFYAHVPGAKQTVISLVQTGPRRQARDYVANTLMANILGGSFSSRINMTIREKKGYAYGAWGVFTYRRHHGAFVAGASVRNGTADDSIRSIMREIELLKKGPITKAELKREVDGAILRLPSFFSSSRATLGTYSNLIYYGLPLNSMNSYIRRHKRVSLKSVQGSARKHIAPSKLRLIVVGDAKHFADKLPAIARDLFGGSRVVRLDFNGAEVAPTKK